MFTKYLIPFVLLLAAQSGFAQVYKYEITHIAGDSFYMVERVYSNRDTSVKYTAMGDTSQIKEALRLLKREQKRLERDWKAMRTQADSLQSRYDQLKQVAIDSLNISGFGGGGNNRSAAVVDKAATVEQPAAPAGYWVISSPSRATFVHDLGALKSKAIILNPDGSTTNYVPPKRVKSGAPAPK